MATTNITFSKVGDIYEATFVSQGPCVIQLDRDKKSPVSVSANISGMQKVPIANFSNAYMEDVIFELDLTVGLEVTIKSQTEVKSAKMLTE